MLDAPIAFRKLVTDPLHNLLSRNGLESLYGSFDFWASFDGRYIEELRQLAATSGLGFWVGPEHPLMGRFFEHLTRVNGFKSVVEVGYQCGGASVPIITALNDSHGRYLGLDLEREGAGVGFGSLLGRYLEMKGLTKVDADFVIADAEGYLKAKSSSAEQFDLVFIDHAKDRYLPTLQAVIEGGLCQPGTVFAFHDIYSFAYPFMPAIYRQFKECMPLSSIRGGLALCRSPVPRAPHHHPSTDFSHAP